MSFGEKLKKIRIHSKLTQAQLANKLNLSKANISKYEANLVEPNLTTLRMLSDLFEVSVDFLLEKAEYPQASVSNGSSDHHPPKIFLYGFPDEALAVFETRKSIFKKIVILSDKNYKVISYLVDSLLNK